MRTYFYKLLAAIFSLGLCCVVLGFFALFAYPPLNLSKRPVPKWQPDIFNPPIDLADKTIQTANSDEAFLRPLFSPTRKPFVPVVVTPEPAPPEVSPAALEPVPVFDPNQLVLKGIMMSSNQSVALISTPDQTNGVWLRIGSGLMGWRIDKIEKNSVILRADGQLHVLKQYVDNAGERLGSQTTNP
jgi:type II secretory pathway component PulC